MDPNTALIFAFQIGPADFAERAVPGLLLRELINLYADVSILGVCLNNIAHTVAIPVLEVQVAAIKVLWGSPHNTLSIPIRFIIALKDPLSAVRED